MIGIVPIISAPVKPSLARAAKVAAKKEGMLFSRWVERAIEMAVKLKGGKHDAGS